jgi:NAD(P)H-dependent flavin oxidoreductase YrpB (nitropropane dioxygenase family)
MGQLFAEVVGRRIVATRQEVFFFGTPPGDARWDSTALPTWVHLGERVAYGVPSHDRRGLEVADDTAGPEVDPTTLERVAALRATGAVLLASVTSLAEGRAAEAAGMDAVVAQGYEAGGHRGVFDPAAPDEALGTLALTRLLVRRLDVPVVAAGGIMDGAGIAAALRLGAAAAQLGTAFVTCPESSASPAYREALLAGDAVRTVITSGISGRPARCLTNRFTALAEDLAARTPPVTPPDYPIAYDAGKALHAAAAAQGEDGYGAQWAGQGGPLARALPAAELVAILARELRAAEDAPEPMLREHAASAAERAPSPPSR